MTERSHIIGAGSCWCGFSTAGYQAGGLTHPEAAEAWNRTRSRPEPGPKWRAVGAKIVPCGACGKDNEVIYRLRRQWHGSGPGIFIYRCRDHSDITDLTDPKQVEW